MEHLRRSSQLKVFFGIYLLISLSIIFSIFFLTREQNNQSPSGELFEARETLITKVPVEREPNKPEPGAVHPEAQTPPFKNDQAQIASAAKERASKESVSGQPTLSPAELKEINELYPFPLVKPLLEIVKNWEVVPLKAFPKLVAIKKPIDFEVAENGQVVARGRLPAGSMMVPVKLQGDRLFLQAAGSMPIHVAVQVEDTDFKESIEARYNRFLQTTNSSILAKRKAEMDRRVGAVNLEKSLSAWNAGTDPRFEPLKTSFKMGDVGTYSIYDAAKWRWGGSETIDGDQYDTAFVLIVSEAAFGVTEREIKAVISLGKVEKWIDATTGEKI